MKAAILFLMLPMCTLAVLTDISKCFETLEYGIKVPMGRCEDRLVDGVCEKLFDAPINNGMANAQVDERCYVKTDLSNLCPDRCMQCCEQPMYACENVASQETCAAMKQFGGCENAALKDYMIKNCPNTCGFCELAIESPCGEGWTEYRPARKCFKIFPDDKRFYEANDTCYEAGGVLAVPKSKAENDFIGMNVTDAVLKYGHIWLGIRIGDGIRSSADGGVLTYENWQPGQPDADNGCVHMKQELQYLWNDMSCTAHYQAFACEKSLLPPSPCPDGWTHFPESHKCYLWYRQGWRLQNAIDFCTWQFAILGTPKSEAENKFFIQHTGWMMVWLGIKRGEDSIWKTQDDKEVSYTSWWTTNGEPRDDKCARSALPDGSWYTVPCDSSEAAPFVCEKDERK